jgi:hypothetical protein
LKKKKSIKDFGWRKNKRNGSGSVASDINNYRPISLLSSFPKILEKIVQIRLTNYLNTYNLITPPQFGFRSGHSTVHPMSLLLNKVTGALNEKKNIP